MNSETMRIEQLLAAQRYETARRRALEALARGAGERNAFLLLLHTALRRLGVLVQGEGIDDCLFFSRRGCDHAAGGVRFQGKYGLALRRAGHRELLLLDGTTIAAGDLRIDSEGSAVSLRVDAAGVAEIVAAGAGRFSVTVGAERFAAENVGRQMYRLPHDGRAKPFGSPPLLSHRRRHRRRRGKPVPKTEGVRHGSCA